MHEEHICDSFASLLLKAPPLIVKNIRSKAKGNNDQFVQTVLSKWHSREGTPVPFTWRELIQCMKDTGLDQNLVKIIEQEVLGKLCASENKYTK